MENHTEETFSDCFYEKSDFRGAHFSECHFKNCNLHLVNVDGTIFQDVRFDECKIVGIEFFRVHKKLFSLEFKNCVLMGCNFSHLRMKKIRFSGCKVKDCIFNETVLEGAEFKECDLQGTLFHHADLSKADFRDAVNYSIDPQANNLKKAKFSTPEVLSLLNFFDIEVT